MKISDVQGLLLGKNHLKLHVKPQQNLLETPCETTAAPPRKTATCPTEGTASDAAPACIPVEGKSSIRAQMRSIRAPTTRRSIRAATMRSRQPPTSSNFFRASSFARCSRIAASSCTCFSFISTRSFRSATRSRRRSSISSSSIVSSPFRFRLGATRCSSPPLLMMCPRIGRQSTISSARMENDKADCIDDKSD